MAEPISIQQLKDASEDAISLAEFINKPENAMIPRRLSSDIHSLQYYLDYMKSFAQRSYETYDEMVANASNLSENVSVFVTNDSATSKNGIYTYNGTSFVKGEYQPENAAKEFVEAKLEELPPFEDGVLADTFVTATASGLGAIAINQREINSITTTPRAFRAVGSGSEVLASSIVPSVFPDLTALKIEYPFVTSLNDTLDYIGLQAAFNKGGVVIINRPYVINRSLSVNVDDTEVLFMGSGKITIKSNVNIINVYADKIKILKAKLVGFGSPSSILTTGTGITLHGTKGCEVSYADIVGTGGSGIALLARTVGSLVKSCVDNVIAYNDIDCTLTTKNTYDSAGILIGYAHYQGTGYSHDYNHIYGNHVQGSTAIDHGIAMIGHGKGNRFTQNTVENCLEYGILVYQSPYVDNTLYDNNVSNNFVKNIGHVSDNLSIKGMGIYLQKSDTTLIHGNTVENVLLGTNNDTGLSRAAIAVAGCVGVVVSDNVIKDSKQFGIQFAESYGCKAVDNYIDGCLRDIVRITSSSVIDINNNTLLGGGAYGVFVQSFARTTGREDKNGTSGESINISGNKIVSADTGIWFATIGETNKLKQSVIQGNTINSPAISIFIDNLSDVNIDNNKCYSNSELARIQVGKSTGVSVNGNMIAGNDEVASGRIVLSNATNYLIGDNQFGGLNSATPIYVNGSPFSPNRVRTFAATPPTVGTYNIGDVVWKNNPAAGSEMGWVCTNTTGAGVWMPFGVVSYFATSTTSSIQSASNPINTRGKFAGKEVFNQVNGEKYWAKGADATSTWTCYNPAVAAIVPV